MKVTFKNDSVLTESSLTTWIIEKVAEDNECGIHGSSNIQLPAGETSCAPEELFVRASAVAEVFGPLTMALGLAELRKWTGQVTAQ
jgi:hypothetical protein